MSEKRESQLPGFASDGKRILAVAAAAAMTPFVWVVVVVSAVFSPVPNFWTVIFLVSCIAATLFSLLSTWCVWELVKMVRDSRE